MVDNYFDVEQLIANNRNKIIVMASHGDQAKNPEKSFKEICGLFEEECPNVTNLIFYSDGSSRREIANYMYNCMSNMPMETLDITLS